LEPAVASHERFSIRGPPSTSRRLAGSIICLQQGVDTCPAADQARRRRRAPTPNTTCSSRTIALAQGYQSAHARRIRACGGAHALSIAGSAPALTRRGDVGANDSLKASDKPDVTTKLTTISGDTWLNVGVCGERRASSASCWMPLKQAMQGEPLLWQARGRRFESAMLHPILNSNLALWRGE